MSDDSQNLSNSDERDATIERLECSLAEEREHSAEVRRTIEELRFQMDILERSYSKQLEDARQLLESAENARSELNVRITELDEARADAIQLLTEAKIELDRLTAERDQLRKQVDGADQGCGLDAGEGTINTLMDDAKWLRRARPDDDEDAREPVAENESPEAEAEEELIAPDVVFSAKRARD